jgi:hypothetical protein
MLNKFLTVQVCDATSDANLSYRQVHKIAFLLCFLYIHYSLYIRSISYFYHPKHKS